MTTAPKGLSCDLQFSLYRDKFSLQKMRRVVVTLLLQFGPQSRWSWALRHLLLFLLGCSGAPAWAPSCSDHLYAVKLKHAKGLLVNGKAARKLF